MADYNLKSYNLKQTIADEAGSLIEFNISYPQLSDMKNLYLAKRFNDYYSAIADGLQKFANNKLVKLAVKSRSLQGIEFKKWALVGKYCCVKSDENIEIKLKLWIFKDGARKEKMIVTKWSLNEEVSLLFRITNKIMSNIN